MYSTYKGVCLGSVRAVKEESVRGEKRSTWRQTGRRRADKNTRLGKFYVSEVSVRNEVIQVDQDAGRYG